MHYVKKVAGIFLLSGLLFLPENTYAMTKKETVYIHVDTKGNPYQTVVNNHLYVDDSKTIEDETELKDILNINGEEKFTIQNNTLKWQNNGKDIFYKGRTDKELPISVKVLYYLDDKEMDAKDMVGKKGRVKIEFTFENHSYVYQNKEKLYTPMVVTLGTILEDTENSHMTISSGKAVDTGNKSILVGIASPGLYQSTGLEELKGLDQIVIEYETNKFSLNNIYMVMTPKVLEEADLKIFDKVDSLSSSISVMSTSMNQIEKGTKELEKGSQNLKNGSKEIVTNLENAVRALKKLETGSGSIEAGLKQVIASLKEADASFQNANLTGSITNLQTLKNQNTAAIETLTQTNRSLQSAYEKYQLNTFTTEEALTEYFTSMAVPSEIIQNLLTCKKTYEGNLNLLTLLTANNTAVDATISNLTSLSVQVQTLISGLTTALNQIDTGALTLQNGLTEIRTGVEKLYEGAITLDSGVGTLGSGLSTVSAGVSVFNKEGMGTLSSYVKKADQYAEKIKMLTELSKEYKGYASKNAENTLFVYKVKSVK